MFFDHPKGASHTLATGDTQFLPQLELANRLRARGRKEQPANEEKTPPGEVLKPEVQSVASPLSKSEESEPSSSRAPFTSSESAGLPPAPEYKKC